MRRHILDKPIYGKNKNDIVRKVKTNVREMRNANIRKDSP